MITAEVSSWSVIFYGNGEASSRNLLRAVYDNACKTFAAGSVGVLDLPRDSETLVHVDLLHCSRHEAEAILTAIGIPLTQVDFRDTENERDGELHPRASQQNRKK